MIKDKTSIKIIITESQFKLLTHRLINNNKKASDSNIKSIKNVKTK
jgi:hypothetical protein